MQSRRFSAREAVTGGSDKGSSSRLAASDHKNDSVPSGNSTLDSVVHSLVRASMGTSVPSEVDDADLDRYVADLILKESQQRQNGGSNVPQSIHDDVSFQPSRAASTNKRFLASIIRNVDGHNRAQVQALSQATQMAQREEDVDNQDNCHHDKNSRERSSKRSPRTTNDILYKDIENLRKNRRAKERKSPVRETQIQSKPGLHSEEAGGSHNIRESSTAHRLNTGRLQNKSKEPSVFRSQKEQDEHHPSLPMSKMDKYFAPDYDPALDVSMDDATNKNSHLIGADDATQAAWDSMLRVLRQRDEDRAEKRRRKEARAQEKQWREERRSQRVKGKKKEKSAQSYDDDEEDEKRRRKRRKHANSERQLDSHDSRKHRDRHQHHHRSCERSPTLSPTPSSGKYVRDRKYDDYHRPEPNHHRSHDSSPHRRTYRDEGRHDHEGVPSSQARSALMNTPYSKTREWDLGKTNRSF